MSANRISSKRKRRYLELTDGALNALPASRQITFVPNQDRETSGIRVQNQRHIAFSVIKQKENVQCPISLSLIMTEN